jgi:hypothetical protein
MGHNVARGAVSLNNNNSGSSLFTSHFSADDIKQASKLWCQCGERTMLLGTWMQPSQHKIQTSAWA